MEIASMKRYYAFEFKSGRHTTTGWANSSTGLHSCAGDLAVFTSKSNRDAWVAKGRTTSDMQDNCRKSVTAKIARSLHFGLTVENYNEMLQAIVDAEVPKIPQPETYQDVSALYDNIGEEVRESGSQCAADEHQEICHILMDRHGDAVKAIADALYSELPDTHVASQGYAENLVHWDNLNNWINNK
jgi:hypothetical protein